VRALRAAAATLLASVLLGASGLVLCPAPAMGAARGSVSPLALSQERHAGIYRDGGVLADGAAHFFGSPVLTRLAAPIVAMAATPDGGGYWLVGANGAVYGFGDAVSFGDLSSQRLAAPIVAMAATPDGGGYWLVGANGAVYGFGDAGNYGSPGQVPDPIVGLAPTPDGRGYWLVTDHGAVYSFGDARYYGSLGATNLHDIPVVAIASSADGKGYWLVQGGGEVTAYGDAPRLGSMRGHPPVSAIAPTSDGMGYWLVCNDGEVDAFGDAARLGGHSKASPTPPISDIVSDPAGAGYWLLDAAAFWVRPVLSAPNPARQIVGIASSQLGPSPKGGGFCNPYGPCEQWCSLFATWVWEHAGIAIARYAFAGDIYWWAKSHTRVLSAGERPSPGDIVLYGSGPANVRTSPHVGIVAQVWPDGEVDTIEGDAGPGRRGWTAVVINGPFLPAQSFFANGYAIYGYAVP
jgi:hypothetical protein